ncbi:hypothetical protein PSTT_10376 [Puccinia striiformis]|uniref:Uncharacterized protein n=1 Tax=Puccinia striiformis TaxID=27350 RepID=A0A2S4V4K2_9BASI|nr:hypothetical protein PSTT_10376 [Puccinia striiformis]
MPSTRSSGRNTRSTSRTVPVSKKNRASQKLKKTASRKRSRLTTEDNEEEEEEEEEEEINHCEGRPNEENLDTNFTLGNFKSQLPLWSIQKLRDVLAKRKKACSNRVHPNVQEALVLLQQNYIKSILMLSLLGRISENTTAKFLGENKPSRKKSNWNRLVAFSVTSEQTPFPPKGWEEHNIPFYFGDLEEEDDGGETVKLTQEEDECYRPLYEKLVNTEKIKLILSQGTVSHNKTSDAFKQTSSQFQRLNSELFTITNLYNSTYCILTSSRAPGVNSFCHEYSNDVGWLAITKSRWASKETFEAYIHSAGHAIQIKLLAEARGTPVEGTTFPKTKDPASKLGLGLQIVQSEQSKLSAESLMKGYEAMNTEEKRKWLNDIESGAFKIQAME